MYKLEKNDVGLSNIPVQLVGPSISAEFFDSLGLIISGLNPISN